MPGTSTTAGSAVRGTVRPADQKTALSGLRFATMFLKYGQQKGMSAVLMLPVAWLHADTLGTTECH